MKHPRRIALILLLLVCSLSLTGCSFLSGITELFSSGGAETVGEVAGAASACSTIDKAASESKAEEVASASVGVAEETVDASLGDD